MYVRGKKSTKFGIYTTFTLGEIRLILDAFERVNLDSLQKEGNWELVAFTRQVYCGIKRDALDTKWSLWSSNLMSKLYKMTEGNTKELVDFILNWRQETEGQKQIILSGFLDPGPSFSTIRQPAA